MNTHTVTPAPPVTLGTTTYSVEVTTYTFSTDSGREVTTRRVWLTGPRGALYFLREFTGADDGLRQVISWKSGQPLRVRGNEVRVYHLGDVIEVAR